MDAYQQYIHKSRYARYLPEEQRRETWEETVNRYINFWVDRGALNDFDVSEIFKSIHDLDVMPSMRALMTAGEALDRDNVAGFNCSYLPIDHPKAFDELMYVLLCGTGVGFSVERQYISKLPEVAETFHETDTVINVADSKIGWAKSFRELVSLLYSGQVPRWDVSRVRPSGAPLRVFGGRASGPEPLLDLFRFTVELFKGASGRKLSSIECHDLCCKIAQIVVVGGVRRSALISLSNLTDDRIRRCKHGQWWVDGGVLDCSKLHTYKYNEDLFRKVTTLADGKNHGLVFILDWSGSMGQVMEDTIKQLFNLIWFCKKVSIPFDVYAFTSDYPLVKYNEDGSADMENCRFAYERRNGTLHIPEWFSMMNILTSSVNAKSLEQQMKSMFRIAHSFKYYSTYKIPVGMGLSGTPLNEAMICLHQIIPQFKQHHKLQKVQCVILTDGEACMTKYDRELQRRWEDEPFIGTGTIRHNSILRDRKTGNTYSLDCEWYEMTDILLRNLQDTFKDTNFIGIRVLESRDAGAFIRRYCGYHGELHDKTMSAWKKQKAFSIKSSGYSTYFGLSANALSQDSEFNVADDATKTQIKSAFVKSLRSKKMNKKILGEFVELIA